MHLDSSGQWFMSDHKRIEPGQANSDKRLMSQSAMEAAAATMFGAGHPPVRRVSDQAIDLAKRFIKVKMWVLAPRLGRTFFDFEGAWRD